MNLMVAAPLENGFEYSVTCYQAVVCEILLNPAGPGPYRFVMG